ncbi:MAG: flagellar basal body rod protein FlgC [Deltaproteobacteria bacterium]|nr:flagellar basal body rod protein FlgC [Deltaproteobacteria bacterium]
MDFSTTFKICGAGLSAARARLDVVTSNLANVNTTKTEDGGPYKKKSVSLASEPVEGKFNSVMSDALKSVKVDAVTEDANAVKMTYEPGHPDANADGFVAMPDINIMMEMANMITASRSYEANVTAFDATKNMALKTLELGK